MLIGESDHHLPMTVSKEKTARKMIFIITGFDVIFSNISIDIFILIMRLHFEPQFFFWRCPFIVRLCSPIFKSYDHDSIKHLSIQNPLKYQYFKSVLNSQWNTKINRLKMCTNHSKTNQFAVGNVTDKLWNWFCVDLFIYFRLMSKLSSA